MVLLRGANEVSDLRVIATTAGAISRLLIICLKDCFATLAVTKYAC